MMSNTKDTRGPVYHLPSLGLAFYPFTTHMVVEVNVHRRGPGGRTGGRVAYWHISVTRDDVAGLGTDDVLRIILKRLLRRLEPGCTPDPADYKAVGPGAPLGATGGTVTQDTLPGL